jgi:hypothetical protein
MADKYSKLEEKVEEAKRRGGVLDKIFEEYSGLLTWENIAVNTGERGLRLNAVEVVAKSSVVRFVLNQKKKDLEKRFGEEFLDNAGNGEILCLRIR